MRLEAELAQLRSHSAWSLKDAVWKVLGQSG
jgi:hypothetical protein